jgi:hypothetical protein
MLATALIVGPSDRDPLVAQRQAWKNDATVRRLLSVYVCGSQQLHRIRGR